MTISEIKAMETEELLKKGNALLKKLYDAIQLCRNKTSLIARIKPIKNELEKRGYFENIYALRFDKRPSWWGNGMIKVR